VIPEIGIEMTEAATLPKRLVRREMDMLAQLDPLRQWKAVVEPFYARLDEEQRKAADRMMPWVLGLM